MSWTLDTHKEFRWSNPEDFQKKITSGGPPLGPDSALVCPTLQQASREIAPGCHFWSRPAVKWSKNSNWNHTCSACNNLEGWKKKTSLSIKQWAVRHQLRHLVGCLWQPTSTVMSISVFNLDLHCHGCQWSHESALGRELLKDATLGPRQSSNWLHCSIMTSWWFQPIWNWLVKLDHFPQVGGENKKYLSCHHLNDQVKALLVSSLQMFPGRWHRIGMKLDIRSHLFVDQEIRLHEKTDRMCLTCQVWVDCKCCWNKGAKN